MLSFVRHHDVARCLLVDFCGLGLTWGLAVALAFLCVVW